MKKILKTTLRIENFEGITLAALVPGLLPGGSYLAGYHRHAYPGWLSQPGDFIGDVPPGPAVLGARRSEAAPHAERPQCAADCFDSPPFLL